MVPIDDRLRRTLEEVGRLGAEEQYPMMSGNGKLVEVAMAPEPPAVPGERKPAGRSRLTPKEIQAELRAGRTVQEVARRAGTEISWIERFVGPILAEREGIVEAVKAGVISRPRRGRSSLPVGQSIVLNLRERKQQVSSDSADEGWKVQRRNGVWEVTFRYSVRGQARDALFVFDPESRTVSALNPVAAQIGWRSLDQAGAAEEEAQGPERVAPPRPAPALTARATPVAKPVAKPQEPAPVETGGADRRPGRPNLWGSAVATGGSRVPPPAAPAPGGMMKAGDLARGEGGAGSIGAGKAAGAGPTGSGARDRGRERADRAERLSSSPHGAGPSDERPSFARNSSSPRPKRLLSGPDEDAFKSAVAKSRATRRGAPAAPVPPPRSNPPRPPSRKRLPDDWLLEP